MFQPAIRAAIVAPLALLALSPGSLAAPARATAVTSATAQAGGLRLTVRIADGPYFLSEMVPVTITLENHSGAAVRYVGNAQRALGAAMRGGTKPYYPAVEVPAGGGAGGSGAIANGQTLAQTTYVVLRATGRVTIAPALSLQGGGATGAGPLAGHLPALGITVSPTIPFSAMLALRYGSHAVRVSGPAPALSHLVYQYALTCGGQAQQRAQPAWQSTTATIGEPSCTTSGRAIAWYVVVGAPGYAVASARYCAAGAARTPGGADCKQMGAQQASL